MSLPEPEPVLAVSGLTKRYGHRTALDEVSFALTRGEVHGVLGPNGSGKTTCLHLVTGLLAPDAGEVLLNGVPVQDKKSRDFLGMAPDDLPMPASLTGQEYLDFHDRLRGRDDSVTAADLAWAFGLAEDLGRQIAEYSHGMKRKLQVIAAVMHFPDLLILDEPFRGLDPDAAVTLRKLITSYAGHGGAVLIATHDMLRAQRDCDRVTILHAGAVVAEGSPAQLQHRYSVDTLEEAFLVTTGLEAQQAERAQVLDTMMKEGWERS
ncbi:ABC transporter ATP-binding protein [Actinoplanes solisilvae]|uniref:ABC transporter ATP-binding protein n=1 Tax=Actinoplanes solisilvae TaxID=2486853 RepID=UPI0013E307C6|nr:ABC transporter ATP-binding protein [Actinoplanes solisilvae]